MILDRLTHKLHLDSLSSLLRRGAASCSRGEGLREDRLGNAMLIRGQLWASTIADHRAQVGRVAIAFCHIHHRATTSSVRLLWLLQARHVRRILVCGDHD